MFNIEIPMKGMPLSLILCEAGKIAIVARESFNSFTSFAKDIEAIFDKNGATLTMGSEKEMHDLNSIIPYQNYPILLKFLQEAVDI